MDRALALVGATHARRWAEIGVRLQRPTLIWRGNEQFLVFPKPALSEALRVERVSFVVKVWIFRVSLRDKCQGPTSVGPRKSSPLSSDRKPNDRRDVRLSGGTPRICPMEMRHQGVLPMLFSPAPDNASPFQIVPRVEDGMPQAHSGNGWSPAPTLLANSSLLPAPSPKGETA